MATDHSDKHTEARVIHHDGLSRLFATLHQSSLGAEQADRLWASLDDPHRASALRNIGLFQDPLTAAGKQDAAASSSLPLEELLPEWYEMHNRRCRSCQSPLLLGVNASFSSSTSQGILCRPCASVNGFAHPDRTSKRALRSQRVRKANAAEAQKPAAMGAPAAKRHRDWEELSTAAPPDDAQGHPSTAVASSSSKSHTSAPVGTLDHRKAELKRKAKVAKLAPTPAGLDDNSDRSTAMAPARRDSSQEVSSRLPSTTVVDQAPSNPTKHMIPTLPQPSSTRLTDTTARKAKPVSGEESSNKSKKKDALRDALAANRKKKNNKEQQGPASSSSSGGLQAFLSNL